MFDPVRSYDKPGVIIHQVANGIASTSSVRRVLFDPAALSPSERMSFSDKLKEDYGGNAVSDTVIDVLTNPVVWLGVLTGAAAGIGAKNVGAGKRFFDMTSGAAAYARTKFPFIRSLYLTNAINESHGRRSSGLASIMISDMQVARETLSANMQNSGSRVLQLLSKKWGVEVTSFDPEVAPNPGVAQDLKRIRGVMQVRQLEWTQDRVERVAGNVSPDKYHIRLHKEGDTPSAPRLMRTVEVDKTVFDELSNIFHNSDKSVHRQDITLAEHEALIQSIPGLDGDATLQATMNRLGISDVNFRLGLRREQLPPEKPGLQGTRSTSSLVEGGAKFNWTEVQRKALVADESSVQAVQDEFQLDELLSHQKTLYEHGRVLTAGDEAHYAATGEFKADPKKILRMVRSKLNGLKKAGYMTESGTIETGGEEAVVALLSDEVAGPLMESARGRMGSRIKQGATAEEIEKVVVDTYTQAYSDKRYIPRNTIEAYDASGRAIRYNPYTGAVEGEVSNTNPSASGRTMLLSRTAEVPYHPDDLQDIADNFGGTDALNKLIDHSLERRQEQLDNGGVFRAMRIAPDIAAAKYIASTSRDYVAFSKDYQGDARVQAVMRDYGPGRNPVKFPGPTGRMESGGAMVGSRNLDDVPAHMRPAGGYSMWDLLDSDLQAQAKAHTDNEFAVNLWRKHVIPSMFGIKPVDDAAHVAAASKMREATLRFANSNFMRAVEGQNKTAARFIQQMRTWGLDAAGDSVMPWQAATKVLYASHLGLNMGSALINTMQPLQAVHVLGFKETAKAYGQSFEMMWNYIKGRAELGPRATMEQLQALKNKHFTRDVGGKLVKLTDVADISSTWGMVEQAGFGVNPMLGKPKFSMLEMMMKMFQGAETLNRTVTANAVLNSFQNTGRFSGLDAERAVMDARVAVQHFQFGSSPLNRPFLFYTGIGRNPAMRQFAQYGLRSFANLFTTPVMISPERKVGPFTIKDKGALSRAAINLTDLSRMAAVSAVVYEVGKNMLGVDMSRGLAFGGVTDIVGGQNALNRKDFPMYVPPVLDVGWGVARYLGTGDSEILQDWAPRAIPGGVAISRALGVAPQEETIQALGLQKTFADWRQAESGMVPVYNSDGRFMGQYPTSDLVLRALGADMGRFNNPQEVEQFLMKNRDAIRDHRRRYIAAVLGNNMSAAKAVKNEFESRFNMPLTVTQDQFKQAQKLRDRSIVSRTLDTMDRTVRDQYREAVAQSLPGQLMDMEDENRPQERGDVYRFGYR